MLSCLVDPGAGRAGIHRSRFQGKWGFALTGFHQRAPDGSEVTFLRETWIGPYDEIWLIDDPHLEWRDESPPGVARSKNAPREYTAYWKGRKASFFLAELQ